MCCTAGFRGTAMAELRILVTGSRRWTRASIPTFRAALLSIAAEAGVAPGRVLVIHGAQGVRRGGVVVSGCDLLVEEVARRLGMAVDPHPADWPTCAPGCRPGHRRRNGRGTEYCPTAGHRRNAAMVALGAHLCSAWPLGESPGTRGCMALAEAAGIPVRNLGDPDAVERPGSFGEAIAAIHGTSWLAEAARSSLRAANDKFGTGGRA